jgi:outer membrane beta-barrel protein
MTHQRNALGVLALATAAAVALLPRPAAASKADAFEGKIQPVSGQLFRKAGRLELTLGGDLSLNDAFFRKGFGDLKLGYHLFESLSVSAHVASGAAWATNSTTVCPTGESCRPATEAQLRQVPGRIRGIFGAEVAWSPIYGKLNTFSEKVAHIDLSLLAGLDWILHDQVLLRDASVEPTQEIGVLPLPFTDAELPFSAHVGVGVRLFLSETFAVRLDLKDYIYGVTVPNGEDGLKSRDMQNQIMAELGVSVFFPFTNRRQP